MLQYTFNFLIFNFTNFLIRRHKKKIEVSALRGWKKKKDTTASNCFKFQGDQGLSGSNILCITVSS